MRPKAAITRFAEREAKKRIAALWRPRRLPKSGKIDIGVVPDTQLRPFAPIEHMRWAGEYFADRRPAYIVHLGDGPDNPSMGRHATPLEREGARVKDDLACWREGLREFENALRKAKGYRPRKHYAMGNHCDFLARKAREDPSLEGAWGSDPFHLKRNGWEVHPFLEPFEIAGVWFAHYWPRGPSGRVTQTHRGAPSAMTMLKREMKSVVAGHMQGLDTAIYHTADKTIRGIIAGSYYLSLDTYMSPQGNAFWRGLLMLHDVNDGQYDLMEVSMDYLVRRFCKSWPPEPWVPGDEGGEE